MWRAAIELFKAVQETDPAAADNLARATIGMPRAGDDFLGFRLAEELGRGAFGRVFLAHQGELSDRPVALKITADLRGEPQTLARLQHTNIVPIYSVHRARPFQAVCMPYFGATTLADLVHSWREREALPESGKELVSTLCNRKSVTRSLQETNGSHRGNGCRRSRQCRGLGGRRGLDLRLGRRRRRGSWQRAGRRSLCGLNRG